jgi:prepilin-type N-terminal cleavage/methylation domain-containing protein
LLTIKKQKNKGFSLVELLVVVAIIGVLAGVGVVGYDRYVNNTRVKVFYQNYDQVLKTIQFEFTIAENDLGSAVLEFDTTGNMIARDDDGTFVTTSNAGEQTKVTFETPCINFLYSVKEHFKHFKNPWNKEWVSVTVDSDNLINHRKGQIQIVCFKSDSGGFGDGSGCPIGKSRFAVKGLVQDRGKWALPHPGAGNNDTDYFRNDVTGGKRSSSAAAGKLDCGWDADKHGAWKVTNQVNTDSGGRCAGNSKGSVCTNGAT